jgi:DNA-binding CsgD family transcriptional regulator
LADVTPQTAAQKAVHQAPFAAPGVRPVIALMVIQMICALIFLSDVIDDLLPHGGEIVNWSIAASEVAAVTGLLLGLVFEAVVLLRLLRRQGQMAQSLAVAQGALGALMEGYFRTWALTPTEADVAAFTIKGYSIAEIAALRGSAEGTIKTHLNAIYRKSGTSGRAQLVSVLVEDLLRGALVAAPANSGL